MDDLISRQWLMQCVEEGWIKFDTERDENIFIHLVRDIAPSAQPEQDAISKQATLAYLKGYDDGKDFMLYRHAWLPTAGCLPDSERRVLCLTKTKKGVLNYVIGYYADGMWRCGMNSNVIAWMELPEPPEEEQS